MKAVELQELCLGQVLVTQRTCCVPGTAKPLASSLPVSIKSARWRCGCRGHRGQQEAWAHPVFRSMPAHVAGSRASKRRFGSPQRSVAAIRPRAWAQLVSQLAPTRSGAWKASSPNLGRQARRTATLRPQHWAWARPVCRSAQTRLNVWRGSKVRPGTHQLSAELVSSSTPVHQGSQLAIRLCEDLRPGRRRPGGAQVNNEQAASGHRLKTPLRCYGSSTMPSWSSVAQAGRQMQAEESPSSMVLLHALPAILFTSSLPRRRSAFRTTRLPYSHGRPSLRRQTPLSACSCKEQPAHVVLSRCASANIPTSPEIWIDAQAFACATLSACAGA